MAVPIDGSGYQDHLADDTIDLPRHTEELVGVCGPGGLVEAVDEIHIHPDDAVHRAFTSFSRTLEKKSMLNLMNLAFLLDIMNSTLVIPSIGYYEALLVQDALDGDLGRGRYDEGPG